MDEIIVREASEEGLPPGVWPLEVVVGREVFRLDNSEHDADGEVLSVWYRADSGRRLMLLND